MKKVKLLIIILVTILWASLIGSAFAEEKISRNEKGFNLGVELGAFIPIHPDPEEWFGIIPGKLDLLLGYQFNPYFTLNVDLWSVWFLVYGAEINPRVNLTNTKVSPFITASAGVVGSPLGGVALLTYSGGLGVDIHVGKGGSVYVQTKYRGATDTNSDSYYDSDNSMGGLEFGVGFRWVF